MSSKLSLLGSAAPLVPSDLFYVARGATPLKATGADIAEGVRKAGIGIIGLFTAAAALTLNPSANVVRTSGYSVEGKGAADYVYDAVVDAAYVAANPNTSFRDTAGRGFRLVPYQTLNWHMFGNAVNDETGAGTDDRAAFVAMLAWQKARRQTGSAISQYGTGAGPLIWCFGASYWSAGITVDYAALLRGFTRGIAGASPTQIRYPANTYGILFDTGSAGHEFEGFTMRGGWDPSTAGTAGDEGEYHAIEWHAPGIKRNIQGYNWQGALLKDANDAFSSGGTHNTNEDVVEDCFAQLCRTVYEPSGGDVNGKRVTGLRGISNRQCVLLCKSFLGSGYGVIAGEANGYYPNWVNAGTTAARPVSLVYRAGNPAGTIWACIGGQETWCRTNAPPSTGKYNQGWVLHPGWPAYSQAVANGFGIITWINNGYYRPGGGVIMQGDSNRSTIDFLYSEDDQLNQFDLNVGKLAGNANNNIVVNASSGTYYPTKKAPFQRGALHDYDLVIGGSPLIKGFATQIGDGAATPASDNLVQFYASNFYDTLWFRATGTGSDVLNGALTCGLTHMQLSGLSFVDLQLGGTTKVTLQSGKFAPADDNVQKLGDASTRWSTVYAGTGTINTSDARHKAEIAPLDDKALDAWGDVQLLQFRFTESIDAKGDAARIHVGHVAQQIRDAFEKHGLDGFRYGVLCYDEWDDVFEPVLEEGEEEYPDLVEDGVEKYGVDVHGRPRFRPKFKTEMKIRRTYSAKLDDQGEPVMRLVTPAGNLFGYRPSQAAAFEAAWQRRELARLATLLDRQRKGK